MSARGTRATCPLFRDVGAEVVAVAVAVAVAAVDQEGGEAVVIAWPCAVLTPPIDPNMSPQLAARP